MKKSRSPIKILPLRAAGHSLFMKRMEIVVQEILFPLVAVMLLGIATFTQWLNWFFRPVSSPWLLTYILLFASVITAIFILKKMRSLKNYDLGLIGERFVAEALANGLRGNNGYYVYNDIQVGRMNIDHVLVGVGGIFTIEVKTARKLMGEKCEINHEGNKIQMNGCTGWNHKALWQAKKEAEYLREILDIDSNKCPHIQPVVVYPGWFVKDTCSGEVWVLNEKYLIEKIHRLPAVLSENDIEIARRKIENFARSLVEREDYRS